VNIIIIIISASSSKLWQSPSYYSIPVSRLPRVDSFSRWNNTFNIHASPVVVVLTLHWINSSRHHHQSHPVQYHLLSHSTLKVRMSHHSHLSDAIHLDSESTPSLLDMDMHIRQPWRNITSIQQHWGTISYIFCICGIPWLWFGPWSHISSFISTQHPILTRPRLGHKFHWTSSSLAWRLISKLEFRPSPAPLPTGFHSKIAGPKWPRVCPWGQSEWVDIVNWDCTPTSEVWNSCGYTDNHPKFRPQILDVSDAAVGSESRDYVSTENSGLFSSCSPKVFSYNKVVHVSGGGVGGPDEATGGSHHFLFLWNKIIKKHI